jgi:hypothetical protein
VNEGSVRLRASGALKDGPRRRHQLSGKNIKAHAWASPLPSLGPAAAHS